MLSRAAWLEFRATSTTSATLGGSQTTQGHVSGELLGCLAPHMTVGGVQGTQRHVSEELLRCQVVAVVVEV